MTFADTGVVPILLHTPREDIVVSGGEWSYYWQVLVVVVTCSVVEKDDSTRWSLYWVIEFSTLRSH